MFKKARELAVLTGCKVLLTVVCRGENEIRMENYCSQDVDQANKDLYTQFVRAFVQEDLNRKYSLEENQVNEKAEGDSELGQPFPNTFSMDLKRTTQEDLEVNSDFPSIDLGVPPSPIKTRAGRAQGRRIMRQYFDREEEEEEPLAEVEAEVLEHVPPYVDEHEQQRKTPELERAKCPPLSLPLPCGGAHSPPPPPLPALKFGELPGMEMDLLGEKDEDDHMRPMYDDDEMLDPYCPPMEFLLPDRDGGGVEDDYNFTFAYEERDSVLGSSPKSFPSFEPLGRSSSVHARYSEEANFGFNQTFPHVDSDYHHVGRKSPMSDSSSEGFRFLSGAGALSQHDDCGEFDLDSLLRNV